MESDRLLNDFLDSVEFLIEKHETLTEETKNLRRKSESLVQKLQAEKDLNKDLKKKVKEHQVNYTELKEQMEKVLQRIYHQADQLSPGEQQ